MMNKMMKQYVGRVIVSIVIYMVMLTVAVWLMPKFEQLLPRLLLALLPVAPTVAALLFFIKALAQFDEFQRRVQFEAVAFSFGATAVLTFGYGFLEIAGLPSISWLYIMPFMVVMWSLGQAIAMRRYS
jgi:hypothetical protein